MAGIANCIEHRRCRKSTFLRRIGSFNEKWIITAAHCMTQLTPSQFQVVAGTSTLNSDSKRHAVARVLIHEAYEKSAPHDSDVALVRRDRSPSGSPRQPSLY